MTPVYLLSWCGSDGDVPDREVAPIVRRQGLVELWHGDRATLYGTANLPRRALRAGRGIVIGSLFDKFGRSAPDLLGTRERMFDPKTLLSDFWGAYVAVVESPEGLSLLRDPSGGLACYAASRDGRHYFTSEPRLLTDCGIVEPAIDWTMVLEALVRRDRRPRTTCLSGITELGPGLLLSLAGSARKETLVWDAASVARRAQGDGTVESLREALTFTLGAWGRSSERPLVEVSGGLDSSIVAAGIAASNPQTSLITFAPSPGDPDELPYARALAEHLGIPLHIARPDIADVDVGRSLAAGLPRPTARAFTQSADALSLARARSIGADAFFSGGGGDDVFGYLRSVAPVIDRFRAEGARAAATTALDIARMNHATLWEVLAHLLERAWRRPPLIDRLDARLMASDSVDQLPQPAPSLPSTALPPGKARHVEGIVTIHNYLEGHHRASFAPLLSPLLSQPIVEACLAVSSWRWCEGGRNRAAARAAFADRLPKVIVERRSKGSFDAFCARLLDRNRERILSMLIDGSLAAHGLLDKAAVTGALRHPSPPAGIVSRVLTLVDVESWASAWDRPQSQRA
jgi:asparagine synthase (glutamine-hydrolysing)